MGHYTYLALMLGTLAYPLAQSFEHRITFYKKWKHLSLGLLVNGAIFIVWDYFFTKAGIWSFNPAYHLGLNIAGMPFEEWLFFLLVPFACMFIYEVLEYFFPQDYLKEAAKPIALTLIILYLVIALSNLDRTYTLLNYTMGALVIIGHILVFGFSRISRFFFMYAVHLIPFSIVNGILTYLPVVRYNNEENLGIRIGSIPIEDFTYSMTMLLIVYSFYIYQKPRIGN